MNVLLCVPSSRSRLRKTINIAQLQAMSMGELSAMARDLRVENVGTMKKHEVIFHILQKNAERTDSFLGRRFGNPAGRLWFLALPGISIICPARKTFTFPPRKSAALIFRQVI